MAVEDRALVDRWLKSLGSRVRTDLKLDEQGTCTVGHASGLDCAIEAPGNGSLYLRVGLFPWEPDQFPGIAERCLLGSFLGMETAGAAFAIDPVDRELVLWIERPLGVLDERSFTTLLTQLLDQAARWCVRLLGADEEEAQPSRDSRTTGSESDSNRWRRI